MQSPVSHASVALLAAGAVSVLLLGAFSPADHPATRPEPAPVVMDEAQAETPSEPALPKGISPEIGEIAKLARAHVDEDVILDYIRNSGQNYRPGANEILYLTDLGLSKNVLLALFKDRQPAAAEPAPPPLPVMADLSPVPAPAPRPAEVSPTAPLLAEGTNPGLFYTALAPYGTWAQLPEYGQAWQPAAAAMNPDWRPYVDEGQWQYTENGWYWRSDYSWGWAPFHYGRWLQDKRLGWVWIPDKTWGPGWVSWRMALGHFGWAPLPPGVSLAKGGGLLFKSRRVAADFDFGLPAAWFTFVQEENFLSGKLPSYALPNLVAAGIYKKSLCVNNYSVVNKKILNGGPAWNRNIAQVSEQAVPARATELAEESEGLPPAQHVRKRDLRPLTVNDLVVHPLPPLTSLSTSEFVTTRKPLKPRAHATAYPGSQFASAGIRESSPAYQPSHVQPPHVTPPSVTPPVIQPSRYTSAFAPATSKTTVSNTK